MRTFDIQEVESQLSKLLEQAATGGPFIITRAGHPIVKVSPIKSQENTERKNRLGFFQERLVIPSDFDQMGAQRIAGLFSGDER
ncbi:type II toxin-antitoxin system Phd/YefM family antitoxin [Bordetella ansorpii]|jgi:prevent-host-death family protein|uniref:type II toxin-antitoxin system Phd/YefM family antitoxin n=1 Tax=Bordetella ansorpii TaxID=288768 RepID=UPI0008319868|nr:type II toxin-antitoxin system prevent-host-death family antitoxin [Bordetella ansorpii]